MTTFNGFDDLADDSFDVGDIMTTERPATLEAASKNESLQATKGFVEDCPKCRGTGRYMGFSSYGMQSLHDGEEWTVRATNRVSEVMNAIQTTDADTLRFRKMNAQGEYGSIGQVYCVYGNSASEVLADYSDSTEMLTILTPAIQRADKLSAVGL